MYKILISGYYGFNNIGDESILTAVVENLRSRIPDVHITVLSQNPEDTEKRYNVKAVNRKSFKSIVSAIRKCDLLVSGGGSLLQDVTSKKSILYYLAIMIIADFFRKPFFIYSQGIGPINTPRNQRLTRKVISKAKGIVVRDIRSKEFLTEIGVPEHTIDVATDPVLRSKKADIEKGREILVEEGFVPRENSLTVGFAIKERKLESDFVSEIAASIEDLVKDGKVQVVLIPFHFGEDMAVALELKHRLDKVGHGDKVYCLKHKYLSEEMLSIIGNMDVLVGVRLHSLIHAAIMDVPIIGISYDPKINSFLHSIGMRAMCSIYDFNREDFLMEFQRTLDSKQGILQKVKTQREILVSSLDKNEDIILKIMGEV